MIRPHHYAKQAQHVLWPAALGLSVRTQGMISALLERTGADLLIAADLCKQAVSGDTVQTEQLTRRVILSTAGIVILLQVGLILITGVGRKQLLIGAETLLASFLLLCLILLVLGLPLGVPHLPPNLLHGSSSTAVVTVRAFVSSARLTGQMLFLVQTGVCCVTILQHSADHVLSGTGALYLCYKVAAVLLSVVFSLDIVTEVKDAIRSTLPSPATAA